jgi:hypothetical protein
MLALEAPSVCCYTLQGLFVMVWRDAPTDAMVDQVHDALGLLVARIPTGVSVLSVIERGAKPPSADARARVSAFQDAQGDRLKRIVFLVDGMGFFASAALAAATAIARARRARLPQDIVRTPEDAVDALLRDANIASRFTLAELVATIAAARADAAERASARGHRA